MMFPSWLVDGAQSLDSLQAARGKKANDTVMNQ